MPASEKRTMWRASSGTSSRPKDRSGKRRVRMTLLGLASRFMLRVVRCHAPQRRCGALVGPNGVALRQVRRSFHARHVSCDVLSVLSRVEDGNELVKLRLSVGYDPLTCAQCQHAIHWCDVARAPVAVGGFPIWRPSVADHDLVRE